MNPTNKNRLALFFAAKPKAAEVKHVPTVDDIKANAFEIFKQIEDRIEADSQTLDQIAARRQNELVAHENAMKNLMARHEAMMNKLTNEQLSVSDSINAAQVMKANIAKIC